MHYSQVINLHTINLQHAGRSRVSIIHVGPYDFCDAENTDGIAESSHKNGIYYIKWNVTEFVKFLNEFIKSRSLHLNQIMIWTNIKPQKDYLNINPASHFMSI